MSLVLCPKFALELNRVRVFLQGAVGFKDAHRALYPLYHRLDQKEISHVTFGDLDQALPELYSGAWTTIEQRLVDKSVYKLEALTAREKAVLNLVSLHS